MRRLWLVELALVAFVPAHAGAAADDARVLTLDGALALAKKNSWALVAERARLTQAETNVALAWALLLPTVAAQGRYTRNYKEAHLGPPGDSLFLQPLNQLDAALSFNAPLIVPAAYPRLESIKADVRAAQANREISENTLLFTVARAFYAAAFADELVGARRSSLETGRATLAIANKRFSAGTVTNVDVNRAELALLRVEQLEREARHARNQAYRALGTLIRIELPFKVVAPTVVPQAPVAESEKADVPQAAAAGTVKAVLPGRPELRSLEMLRDAADERRRTDLLKWAPTLSAFGNARLFNYDNFVRDRYSWALGLQLDWVLFDGGVRDAQRRQAAAEIAEAEARAALLQDNIRDDLANATSLVETKQYALDTATRSVALARRTLDLLRTQYEAGTVTQVDLLQAQDGLVGAQELLVQSHLDVAVADLALRGPKPTRTR